MQIKAEEISKIIRGQIGSYAVEVDVAEVASVVTIGDGIARVHGVERAMAGEILEFPHDVFGIALNLEEESVGVVLLGEFHLIKEWDVVKRTGRIISVPVGEEMLGRVVNPLGRPLDGKVVASLGFFALIFLFRAFRKTPAGALAVDKFLLRAPLFGKLLTKVAISRVTRTLSTLLSGGVSMLESLRITSSTSGNLVIERSVQDVRRMVSEGQSLTQAFKATGRFPLMMSQMVNVGEATGTLDQMLSKMADFYDDEVSASVAALLSVLEPVLMVGVGGIVGGLIIAMYLPIFSLMGQIQ